MYLRGPPKTQRLSLPNQEAEVQHSLLLLLLKLSLSVSSFKMLHSVTSQFRIIILLFFFFFGISHSFPNLSPLASPDLPGSYIVEFKDDSGTHVSPLIPLMSQYSTASEDGAQSVR